ncbi:unnamed protein product [Toxocara canis]|uniref:PAT1 domain-containing protein n=1 Tax=Toxocara canis TaxID=6265 RepID=A0A183UWJ8_TOXCA|nr:unnamed protein product [Toxocara canis]
MSRIGLNGMCGRPLTDEDDFQFGILPDDESEVSGEGEEIDAVNEETFGADVGSLVIDDLEQYSKQTEGLRLEDGLTAWTDEPSCSVSAPDPSQLPIPPFTTHYGNSSYRLASSLNEGSELSASYQLNLGTVDSLWKNGVKDESQSVWAAPPELTSAITRSAFDFINKADSPANSRVQPNYDHHTDKLAQTVEAPKPRALAAIPKGALTLEEIEKNHISLARRSSLPPQPPPIPSEGAMTVTDFERRLLMETAGASGMARAESGERNLPPPPPQALRPQQQQPMPPIPIMPFPFMPPFVAQTLRAHLTGQLPELPPGFPPVPPQMRAAFMAALAQNVTQGPPPGALFGQPPPLIAPPFRPVQRPPILRPSHIHPQLPPHLHYQSAQQLGRVPSIYYRDPQSKRAGLPSGKTISDFAFDPYAGFMSRKEREWLVKIQSLQCQGCGNPYEDDFYYTVWKQRKLAEERRAHGLRPQNTECDFSATVVNAHHYVPPTFEGSLGRPTLPTANFPRLLIDVHSDSVDEEERSNVRSSTQKKLRALLMQLEGVAVLLIECEDRRRQLKASTLPEEIHAQLSNEMRTRVEAAVEFLSSNLRTALLVSKGRHMFARTLSLASKTQQVTLIESLFAVLPLLLKKVDANEFLVNFLLSMLLCCARKKYPIGSEPSPLCSWLSSAEGMCPLDEQWSPSMFLPALTIHTEDLRLLQTWLENNFVSQPTSVAIRMAHILQIICDQDE